MQQFSSYSNIENTDEVFDEFHVTADFLRPLVECNNEVEESSTENVDDIVNCSYLNEINEFEEDAIEYIGGYLIKKLHLNNFKSNELTYTFVDQISEGGLQKPTRIFIEKLIKLEEVFSRINYNGIYTGPQFLNYHINKSADIDLPLEVKKLYFKIRLHNRLKNLNQVNLENKRKKRKLNKIIM